MKANKTVKSNRQIVAVNGTVVKVGDTENWRSLIATFISSQDVCDSSRNLYTHNLTQYFLWALKQPKQFSLFTRQDVLAYKDHLEAESLSSLTIGSYLTVVRKFYEWAEAEYGIPNIAKAIKTPRRKQAFKKMHLTDEKSSELLDYYRTRSIRDFAIVNLILRTGLRTVEVVRADIADISFKGDRRILKVWGKGHIEKDDFVVLSDKAYQPIKQYLEESRRGSKANEPLFTSNSPHNSGGRMTTRSIRRICKEGLVAVNLDGKEFTAHSLRHTTAVAILKHGGSITDVQSVLRHTSPATSQIYTESVKEELRLKNAPELALDNAF